MAHRPIPRPVQLTPPGPYETPVAEGFLGLGISRVGLPPRIHLVIQGGVELQIPLDEGVLELLHKALNAVAEAASSEEDA